MRKTNWKQLFGIVLTAVALFFLFVYLFLHGIEIRHNSFQAPLIDTSELGKAAVCLVVALFGVWLTVSGRRRSSNAASDAQRQEPPIAADGQAPQDPSLSDQAARDDPAPR